MRHSDRKPLAEINITNLVDVTMVLLIIFMLTAPFLQAGVKLRLPKAEAKQIEEQEGVTVSIDENGGIFIDEKAVDWNDFSMEFRKAIEATAPRAFLRADKGVRYETVLRVIARIKMLGIEDLGLIAEQEEKKR
ncbi:MAG: biopolymer transporter ExbD [Candidatus Krumholzibacteria bacterium]|nr:biopolymer transporter ExbD [Candidatus Krumholzibacteria bacterium]